MWLLVRVDSASCTSILQWRLLGKTEEQIIWKSELRASAPLCKESLGHAQTAAALLTGARLMSRVTCLPVMERGFRCRRLSAKQAHTMFVPRRWPARLRRSPFRKPSLFASITQVASTHNPTAAPTFVWPQLCRHAKFVDIQESTDGNPTIRQNQSSL